MDKERLLQFVEPHISGGDSLVTISVGRAIDFALQSHPKAAEMTEDIALDYFIVNHWAWYKDAK